MHNTTCPAGIHYSNPQGSGGIICNCVVVKDMPKTQDTTEEVCEHHFVKGETFKKEIGYTKKTE